MFGLRGFGRSRTRVRPDSGFPARLFGFLAGDHALKDALLVDADQLGSNGLLVGRYLAEWLMPVTHRQREALRGLLPEISEALVALAAEYRDGGRF